MLLRLFMIYVWLTISVMPGMAEVHLKPQENQIDVQINGKSVATFLYKSDMPKPVLHPLKTLSGITLTRGFPLQKIEGESQDHPHQHGLFFTYDKVNEEGFWNNTKIPPQIKVTQVTAKSGEQGEITATMHWMAKSGKTLLEEQRTMVFSNAKDYYSIDFSIKLTALDTAVVFDDTKEGMFGIRVADWLAEKSGNAQYLNAAGDTTEDGVWGKRAAWVRLQGHKDGKKLGIVVINHPASVNYPTFWHVRAGGLFAANPLGQEVFEKFHKKSDAKPFRLTLERGQSAWFKFRLLVHDGEMEKSDIDRIAEKYGKCLN